MTHPHLCAPLIPHTKLDSLIVVRDARPLSSDCQTSVLRTSRRCPTPLKGLQSGEVRRAEQRFRGSSKPSLQPNPFRAKDMGELSRSETKLLPMLRVNISSVSGVIAESTRWLAQWL